MSKKDTDTDNELAADEEVLGEDTAAAEVAEIAEPKPETAQPLAAPVQKKGSGGIAWLALFLSLITLAGIGYMLVQDWRAQRDEDQNATTLADVRSRLTASNESMSNLDRSLTELAEADAQAASQFEILQKDVDERIQLLDSLPSRMSNVESSLATMQGVSIGARNTWLLAEAEYYMQIANAQLQLAGNPQLAAMALSMADERIVQLANPALTNVRRALADELAALEVMQKPDIEGITLTLASLARVVDSLPLKQIIRPNSDVDEVDSNLSGVGRAWASVKGALSGLVRVTVPEESAVPLMTPEAIYFLRTNLTLQLQAARLALLRGEQAIFHQSLDDAAAWLDSYFDTGSAQVGSALQTIDEIRGSVFDVSTPDISESLRLLRQFEAISESAQ